MSVPTQKPETMRLEIDGMHCSSCVSHVEQALASVDGVNNALVSLADSSAEVTGSALAEASLVDAVRKAGYSASPIAAERSIAQEREDLERRTASRALRWRRRVQVGLAIWLTLAFVHWFG